MNRLERKLAKFGIPMALALGLSINNAPALAKDLQGDYKVNGPSAVHQDTIAQFALDRDGRQPYESEAEYNIKGTWLVAPFNATTPRDGFVFVEDPDDNAHTVAIRFKKPGMYKVWHKYAENSEGEPAYTIIGVAATGSSD
jgi:hypothetical protein